MVIVGLKTNLLKFILFFIFSADVIASEKITIAVASNFLLPLKTLKKEFISENTINVRLVSASTSKLYAQILQGAPFDIFLAADKTSISHLLEKGMVKSGDEFLYSKGNLVLWSPNSSSPELAYKQGIFQKIAMANPSFAPYGKAAQEVMKVIASHQGQLVFADNVAQAFQYAFYKNVDAAFVALSQLKMKKINSNYWLIPSSWYHPIEQFGGLLRHAKNKKAANKFIQYLTSAPVQERIVKEFGYAPF